MNLGRPLNDAQKPLVELSKQYKTAAEDMVTLRDAVVNVLNEIGDTAIEAAGAGVSGGAALSVVKATQTGFGSLSSSAAVPKLPPRPETPR